MSSKKKNAITLVLLLVALVACLLLYFLLPTANDNGTEDTKTQTEKITVDTITADKIASMKFEKNGKAVWSLAKKGDAWSFADDASVPVNAEKVATITDLLNPVQAAQTIESAENINDYGLSLPTMTFTVVATDGREYRYDIGTKVPKEDMGYYVKTNAGEKIYCIQELVEGVDIVRNQLIQMDSLPEIEADNMTFVQVDKRKGKDFEAKKVSDKEKVDFYSNWNITKPYAKPLATSSSNWKTTLGYFNAFSYTELVEYKSKKLSKYGLDNPSAVITVKYKQSEKSGKTKMFRLAVGDKTKGAYYVCEFGKKNVYKMDIDVIENMTKLDAYTSMDHCVYSVLATSINGYDVTYGNTTLKVTRTAVEKESDEDAKETETPEPTDSGTAVENAANKNQKNIWTLNGKTISEKDENDFLTPYSTAYLLEYSEKADGELGKAKNNKPVLTIVYHEEKRDVTVKYLPYDGTNFYRVDKNGMDYFLVDKLQVDDIIEKFKRIEKLAK